MGPLLPLKDFPPEETFTAKNVCVFTSLLDLLPFTTSECSFYGSMILNISSNLLKDFHCCNITQIHGGRGGVMFKKNPLIMLAV
jgi:hypothetical protein